MTELIPESSRIRATGQTDRLIVFNSNVQPKRRMREKHGLWHCNCRKPLGPYKLNSAQLKRCPICGVARHSDPTVPRNVKLAPDLPSSDGAGRTSPQR